MDGTPVQHRIYSQSRSKVISHLQVLAATRESSLFPRSIKVYEISNSLKICTLAPKNTRGTISRAQKYKNKRNKP